MTNGTDKEEPQPQEVNRKFEDKFIDNQVEISFIGARQYP